MHTPRTAIARATASPPTLRLVVMAVCAGCIGSPALAQYGGTRPSPPSRPGARQVQPGAPNVASQPVEGTLRAQRRAHELALQAEEAFGKGDFVTGEALLRGQAALEPTSWIPRYNLAIAQAQQNRHDEAAASLRDAIDLGFFDIRQLQQDRALARAATSEPIASWLKDWSTVLQQQAGRTLAAIQGMLGPGAEITRDEDHRVIYANWADPRSFARAHSELRALTVWANSQLFSGIADDASFDPTLDPIIVVALPPRNRFKKWVQQRFGDVDDQMLTQVGGAYEHLHVRLVSIDLGPSLRHEFFHALHWRLCNRLSQRHPIWILEGLASLVEDMEGLSEDAPASATPVPSWRTNTAQRLARSGAMPSLDDMIAISNEAFNTQRPLAKYAHVRALFLYLHQTGMLPTFLRTYMTNPDVGYAHDRSGKAALESALGQDTKAIDRAFRAWLADLKPVAEDVQPGQASLGVRVDSGNGDGVIVIDIPIADATDARAASVRARISPLRVGDVILALDGRATRDIAELVRVLGSYQPDQQVRVSIRRDGIERDVRVTLAAKR